jgi:hypothetical protein
MRLFLIAYRRVTALRSNSRFNGFNSRLDRCQFPFNAQRELARNGLIWPAVFGAMTALIRQNRKNSRFYGKNREPGSGSFERMIVPEAANMPLTARRTDVLAPDLPRGDAAHPAHTLPATRTCRTCRDTFRRGRRHWCRSCLWTIFSVEDDYVRRRRAWLASETSSRQ